MPEVAWALQERDAKGADSDTKEGHLIPVAFAQNQRGELRTSKVHPQLTCGGGKPGEGYPAVAIPIQEISKRQSGTPMNGVGHGENGDPMYTLQRSAEHGVAVQWASGGGQVENPSAQALRANAEHNYQFARCGMSVRRLTPRECERLQGFPDDWTRWDADGKEISDSARYRMLGNAVTVPVANWIGNQIVKLFSLQGIC